MFNVGGWEVLVILVLALVVLGPTELPRAIRQVGKVVGEFRRISSSFQRDFETAINDPISTVTGEPTTNLAKDITTGSNVATPKMDSETAEVEQEVADSESPEVATDGSKPEAVAESKAAEDHGEQPSNTELVPQDDSLNRDAPFTPARELSDERDDGGSVDDATVVPEAPPMQGDR